MFDEHLLLWLRDYVGEAVVVQMDSKQMPVVEGKLVALDNSFLALDVSVGNATRRLFVRAEHVIVVSGHLLTDEPEES